MSGLPSGGPFFSLEARLLEVGPEDARSPAWRMGPKITVDSATMMNKGLEVMKRIISSTFRTTTYASRCTASLSFTAASSSRTARW